MALDLDGFAVLRAIGSSPAAFPELAAEAPKVARALLLKQLKGKATDVARLRAVGEAVGAEALRHCLDGLADKEVTTLLGRLDKHWPALRTASAADARAHVTALAEGRAEPSAKVAGARKPKTAPKAQSAPPAFKDTLGSKAMRATRQRGS